MNIHIHRFIGLEDDPFLVDQKCLALGDKHSIGPIGPTHLFIQVGKQGEGDVVFLLEFAMGFSIIVADPEDFNSTFLICIVIVPEPTGLFRSPRCVVFGVEVDDDVLALEFRKGESFPRFILQRKVRCAFPSKIHILCQSYVYGHQ